MCGYEAITVNMDQPSVRDNGKRSGPPGRVLLVDDNEDGRVALRALLEALGYTVDEARDGYEALEKARARRPDLILMDLMMPHMDGLEATRRIRSIPEIAEVTVVCLSAMEGAQEASLDAGCDACIIKPIYDLAEFGRRVSAWIGSSAASSLKEG